MRFSLLFNFFYVIQNLYPKPISRYIKKLDKIRDSEKFIFITVNIILLLLLKFSYFFTYSLYFIT